MKTEYKEIVVRLPVNKKGEIDGSWEIGGWVLDHVDVNRSKVLTARLDCDGGSMIRWWPDGAANINVRGNLRPEGVCEPAD